MPKNSSRGETTHDRIFPLGIAYISSSLKQAGHKVYTINLEYYDDDTYTAIKKLSLANKINVVGVGGLSRDFRKIKDVIDATRKTDHNIITIVGGGIISADPEPSMDALGADIGVIGEGEVTMCELANALDNNLPYNNIKGLIFKNEENKWKLTPTRPQITNLNTIPLPDFEGFNYDKYSQQKGGLIVGSRSCPFKCTYCFHPIGKIYHQRSLDSIFEEIEYQIKHFKIHDFGLTDELFASNKTRILEFCNRIKKYNISWVCALRVTDVNLALLKRMKESGCTEICYGLESADNKVLQSMNKKITAEQIESAIESTYQANIRVIGQFIFGDIAETNESVKTTLKFWHKHNMQTEISLNMIIAYPGSYLYKYAYEKGIIKDKKQFLIDGCPLVNISKLTDEEHKNLFSLTEELKLHPHTLAKSIKIIDIKTNGECNVEAICRKCGTKSNYSMFFLFKNAYVCPTCTLKNEVDPFTKAMHSSKIFKKSLPINEKIALWGAGGIYYKLIKQYKFLAAKNFLLVDTNKKLHNLSICGKMVYSPEIITTMHIKSVVITAISQKNELRKIIYKHYKSVEKIFIPDIKISEKGVMPILKSYKNLQES